MKTSACLSSAALLLAASTSFAGTPGFNLSWSGCDTSPASTDRSYVCDGQLGSPLFLQGSFRLDRNIPDFSGVSVKMEFVWATTMPDYWHVDTGGCDYAMITPINPSTLSPCAPANLFQGGSGGGMLTSMLAPNRMRVLVAWAAITPTAGVVAGTLYGAFRMSIEVDQGALNGCAGCALPATFILDSVEVEGHATGEVYTITVPDVNATVTWQAQGPTPARNTTWGAVKALYR